MFYSPLILVTAALLMVDVSAFHTMPLTTARNNNNLSQLFSKKPSDDDTYSGPQALSVGTFVEFEEHKRVHIGKIEEQQHKTNGGARYVVIDHEGHKFDIGDKEVHYAMYPPNSPKDANKLFDEFCLAQQETEQELQKDLQISPELLELAWEEALESASEDGDELASSAMLSPNDLIQLLHSHDASKIEKYKAWKFLQTELAHVFFKDIKDHGRISTFKAKARKAVEAAKQSFCNNHSDSDLCLV